MNAATASIFKRAIEEASQLGQHSTGDLAKEIALRLPRNTEIKITARKMRIQHTSHFDDLFSAEDVDRALAANAVLFA